MCGGGDVWGWWCVGVVRVWWCLPGRRGVICWSRGSSRSRYLWEPAVRPWHSISTRGGYPATRSPHQKKTENIKLKIVAEDVFSSLKDTVRNHLILPQNAPPWCPALTAPGMMTNGLSNREASRPTHIRHGLGLGRTFKLRLKCLPGEFADLNMKLIKDVWVQNLSWLTIPWGPSGFVCFD